MRFLDIPLGLIVIAYAITLGFAPTFITPIMTLLLLILLMVKIAAQQIIISNLERKINEI
jgi:hypothetical protein